MQRWGGDLRIGVGQHLLQEGEDYVAQKEAEWQELMELRAVVGEVRTALGVGPEVPPGQLADVIWALRGTEWAHGLAVREGDQDQDHDQEEREADDADHERQERRQGPEDGEAA